MGNGGDHMIAPFRVKGLGNAPLKPYSRCCVMTGSQGFLTDRQIDRKGSPSGTIPGLNVDIPPMLGDDGMRNRQSQPSPFVRPLALGGKIVKRRPCLTNHDKRLTDSVKALAPVTDNNEIFLIFPSASP
jgi:hypothetical protein